MAGEDLSSSELAEPPRTPLPRDQIDALLPGIERDLVEGTLGLGVERWFWGEGVCLLALTRAARSRGEGVPEFIARFVEPYLTTPPVLEHVNNLAPGATLAELYAEDPRPEYARLLTSCLDWYDSAPEATRAPNGALEHWPGGVWADTVYMAGQFLLRAGRVLGREDLVAEATRQWLAHAEVLQDARTGLIAHGTHGGERIPVHWGRANAWFALAGADLVAHDADPGGEVLDRLLAQLGTLARLQPEHGVWDVLVDSPPEVRGLLETSAAAGLGAALLRTASALSSEDAGALSSEDAGAGASDRAGDAVTLRAAGERAVLGSLAYVTDGLLTRVSAGTVLQLIPFGYSVIRDDRPQPWGQGLALEALAAWRDTTPPHHLPEPTGGTTS